MLIKGLEPGAHHTTADKTAAKHAVFVQLHSSKALSSTNIYASAL
jgi:hypothetical protein